MTVYEEPNSPSVSTSLVLAILPAYNFDFGPAPNKPMDIELDSWSQENTSFGALMGSCRWPIYGISTGCVEIPIYPGTKFVESFIVYDPLGQRLSVSVGEAARNPDAPFAVASSMTLDLSKLVTRNQQGQFGLFSSIGQLAQLQSWNMTVDLPIPRGGTPKWVIILSSVLSSVAATIVVAAGVYCYFNSKYRRWKKDLDQLAKTMQSLPGVPTQVDFADIKKATNNFHETTKLGRGGYGAVYGCTLPAAASRTGQSMKVAVKKFTREVMDQRYEDFLAESGGFGQRRQRQQDTTIGQWDTRYGIARDIATGLQYLHHEHEPMVLHRDIKASNIMLDSTFSARLGDFGISCTVDAERSSVTGLAGTIGYIGPEYIINYKATRQTDIYAFGVVILEIVTGKKNTHVPTDDGHITQWVWRLHRDGMLLKALDDMLMPSDNQADLAEEAERLLLLGLACTNPNPSSRPSMTEVLQVINKLVPPPQVSHEQQPLLWMSEEWSSITSEYGASMPNQELRSKAR
ncbi:hypothetical protein HU200_065306 [Digitaria exilis]|uniref:Protein kinase domain-containing protein n=1 Tax=Digitaria exilis TaxID=1010633 RepID=A0A835A8D9_9POAL|nr:hypothetical protein HU200_065306 [Digitaria exilis]